MVTSIPANLENGAAMFSGCNKLTGNIPTFPENSKLTNGSHMFYGCSGLTGEVLSLPSGLTVAYGMFAGCSITGTTPIKPSSLDCSGSSFTFKVCDGTFEDTQVTNDGSWPEEAW